MESCQAVPEMIEVELYRRAADRVVGRTVPGSTRPTPGTSRAAPPRRRSGPRCEAPRSRAPAASASCSCSTPTGPTLGLRFGMTGRLLVDGQAPIERLEYSSDRVDPAWVRFSLALRRRRSAATSSTRAASAAWSSTPTSRPPRHGRARHGPGRAAGTALAASAAPLKAWLLDQHRIAGVGNLLADEALWRAGLDPARPGRLATAAEARRLHRAPAGHHRRAHGAGRQPQGDLQVARVRGATCPRDGTPLLRRTIGGRTTYSCPRHQ